MTLQKRKDNKEERSPTFPAEDVGVHFSASPLHQLGIPQCSSREQPPGQIGNLASTVGFMQIEYDGFQEDTAFLFPKVNFRWTITN